MHISKTRHTGSELVKHEDSQALSVPLLLDIHLAISRPFITQVRQRLKLVNMMVQRNWHLELSLLDQKKTKMLCNFQAFFFSLFFLLLSSFHKSSSLQIKGIRLSASLCFNWLSQCLVSAAFVFRKLIFLKCPVIFVRAVYSKSSWTWRIIWDSMVVRLQKNMSYLDKEVVVTVKYLLQDE